MAIEQIQSLDGAPEGEIELARVEKELTALWAQASPSDPGAQPAVLRARSLNLLVLGHDPAALERVRFVAARTTLAHPSRILLVASEPAVAPPHLPVGARITTFCHRLGGGGRHVCCEEITVVARGAASERLREAALPLLVPDLPVHLWLPGPGRHDPDVVRRLTELADEVIWSARRADEELPSSPTRARQPAYVDLDWMRLRPWCELTAQLFDAPDRRSDLRRVKAVEVVVADPPPDRPGAGWLWVGWIASRLGWRCEGGTGGPHERQLVGPLGRVTATVAGQSSTDAAIEQPSDAIASGPTTGVPEGELLSVRLHLHGWTVPLTLERSPSRDRGDLCISAGGVRSVHLGVRDEAVLLGEALGGAARDRIYEAAWDESVRLWKG